MANLTLIDASGQSTTYNGINNIVSPKIGGGTETYSTGGAPAEVESNDVNFYDYDGRIVASYSAADFAQLSALPANPSHSGLTAQGWNWTLADVQAYVGVAGICNIGQTYITDDGATRIYFYLEANRLSPILGIGVDGSATIDWGDGSAQSTLTGSNFGLVEERHNYATPGNYCISITPTAGSSISILGHNNYRSYLLKKDFYANLNSGNFAYGTVYRNSIYKVEIGNNCSIGSYAFYECVGLKAITIPNGINAFGNRAFYMCYGLQHLTIPAGSIGAWVSTYSCSCCYALKTVCLPADSYCPEGMFSGCWCLERITSFLSGQIGDSFCSSCVSIRTFALCGNITSLISQACGYMDGLSKLIFEPAWPPTVLSSWGFYGLPTDCVIYVPSGSLEAYEQASNYPDPSVYTYVEY